MAAAAIAVEGLVRCSGPVVARAGPITVITDWLRALCLGGPAPSPAIEAAAWIAALLAVTVLAVVTRYRHAIGT
jgi:hypothetical protein